MDETSYVWRDGECVGWAIVMTEIASHFAAFSVFECVKDGAGKISYGAFGDPGTWRDFYEGLDPRITGSVKYDGCMDLSVEPVMHTCDRDEVVLYGRLLTEIFDFAAKHIKAADLEDLGVP